MFNHKNYSQVFGNATPFPDRAFFQETETFRRSLDGVLFIDRVLKALGLGKAKLYPPKTENALKSLHQQVCDNPMSTHHRLSIFYYILLDFDHGKTKLSEEFAAASGIPEKYQIFMKGLWYLDRHQFKRALEYVAHPSLIPDFADDIISVLVRKAPHGDYTLALAYFHTVQPVLKTSQALELLFAAMAHASISQALQYSRTFPEHTQRLLFQKLVASVLDCPPGEDTAERAVELVSLSFDESEEKWFEEYLSGDGSKFKKAKDTLVMRKVVTGRYSEAIGERGLSNQWAPIIQGLKMGLGGRV